MIEDIAGRLRNLQASRDAGDLDDADYERAVARLRTRVGDAAVDAALLAIAPAPGARTVDVADSEQVTVVQGDVGGDVQTGGARYESLFNVIVQAAGLRDLPDAQAEVLASYLDALAHRCDRLRIAGMVGRERRDGKGAALTLSQVYVTLAATAWVTEAEAPSEEAFAAALAAGDPADVLPQDARRLAPTDREFATARGKETPPVARLERPLLLAEALSTRRRLVLLGGPGSGKSTFLRHLAVALARASSAPTDAVELPHRWSAGLLLPVYASLGGFAAWTLAQGCPCDGDTLWQYLLSSSEHDTLEGLSTQLRRAFRKGRMLLMLDGLDEVADPALRLEVARAVAALASQRASFVALTCRARSFDGAVADALADWGEPVTLALLSMGQVSHFVRGWYDRSVDHGTITAADAAGKAAILLDRIGSRKELRDLRGTPLLLTIMTVLNFYDGKLPEDRADLYEDMVHLLLIRWTQQRREAGVPPSLLEQLAIGGLKERNVRDLLEELAFRAHGAARTADGRGLLERDIVRGRLLALFSQWAVPDGPANEKATLVLSYLEHESGLLLHEGGEQYGLPHLTYEEYLAGCYLVRQESRFNRQAYTLWREDAGRWREVILLAVGHMARTNKAESAAAWLRFLLEEHHGERERDERERQQAALFAAECLADLGGKPAFFGVGGIDLPAIWDRLAAVLVRSTEGGLLPAAERVWAGRRLAEVGDPRPGVCSLPPAMVTFPGGTFVIGSTPEEAQEAGEAYAQYYREQGDKDTAERARRWFENEINDQPLTLRPFALAHYPVTNGQYALFVAAGGYNSDAPWWDEAGRVWLRRDDAATEGLERWQRRARKQQPAYWDDERFGVSRANHPVVGITWYEASAFCRWLSTSEQHNPEGATYRLPSEAEWEYAARGTARRAYPWGDEVPDVERANFNGEYTGTSAVGCFADGATAEGLHEMAGNVWQWTATIYEHYPYDPSDGREETGDPAEKRFTLRGGGWFNRSVGLRAAVRLEDAPDGSDDLLGFRLARHLPS